MSTPWIPVEGRDVGPAFPEYINPAAVISARFWTDERSLRTVTLEVTGGRRIDLREPKAIDAVGRLTRGTAGHPDDDEPELPPAACDRPRLGFRTRTTLSEGPGKIDR